MKKIIQDLEQPLINLIGMADALNDCLLFRAAHPERVPAARYDGACFLSGEIKTMIERLYDVVTASPAFEHLDRPRH
jgi:hypothetical protein